MALPAGSLGKNSTNSVNNFELMTFRDISICKLIDGSSKMHRFNFNERYSVPAPNI